MFQEAYVGENGEKIDYSKKYKKNYLIVLIIIVVIALILIIYSIVSRSTKNSFCQDLRDKIKEASLTYAKEKNLLPTVPGDFITVSLDTLTKEKFLKEEDLMVQEESPTAEIVITKYNEDYIVTVDLDNAAYCSTSDSSWSSENEKYNEKKDIVKVTAYYNYRSKEDNYTVWSEELEEDEIKEKESEKYQVRLPKEEKILPSIPEEGEIINIEQKVNIYYRHRDKRWKYYDIVGDYSSGFFSEKPEGYNNYDANTLVYTDWTDYSLNYPEKKSYREIQSQTAYKWYYEDGKKKVYYKNGEYVIKPEDEEKYPKKEDGTKVYRYRDKQYRWYNGTKRRYSGYSSEPVRNYSYRDDALYSYTNWSSLTSSPTINDENRSYREEEPVSKYQYRILYRIYYLDVLEKDLPKEEFEKKVGIPLSELMKDEHYDVEITYKFQYK